MIPYHCDSDADCLKICRQIHRVDSDRRDGRCTIHCLPYRLLGHQLSVYSVLKIRMVFKCGSKGFWAFVPQGKNSNETVTERARAIKSRRSGASEADSDFHGEQPSPFRLRPSRSRDSGRPSA
jgi:hypothetical protein